MQKFYTKCWIIKSKSKEDKQKKSQEHLLRGSVNVTYVHRQGEYFIDFSFQVHRKNPKYLHIIYIYKILYQNGSLQSSQVHTTEMLSPHLVGD